MPFDVTDDPACGGHGGGESDDSAAEVSRAVFLWFDFDSATSEAVANALPAALNRGVFWKQEAEELKH